VLAISYISFLFYGKEYARRFTFRAKEEAPGFTAESFTG
jgi:hypothetical protein